MDLIVYSQQVWWKQIEKKFIRNIQTKKKLKNQVAIHTNNNIVIENKNNDGTSSLFDKNADRMITWLFTIFSRWIFNAVTAQ